MSSPVPLVATATPPDPIYTVRVYVDGLAVLYTPNTTVNQLIWMPNGQHTVEVVAEDTAGYIATTSIQLSVVSQDPGALNIQDQTSWVNCSAVIVKTTCAAGLGNATSTLTLHRAAPSFDGSAAEFTLAGPHPYSNELYWVPLGAAVTSAISHMICGFISITATLHSPWSSTSTRHSGECVGRGAPNATSIKRINEYLGSAERTVEAYTHSV